MPSVNGSLTYLAKQAGPQGNLTRVRHLQTGISTPLSVSVSVGSTVDILVTLATSATGAISCTANQVARAVNTHVGPPSAQFYVAAVPHGTGDGLVVANAAFTSLIGGKDEISSASVVEIERITARVVQRLSEAVPAHVEMILRYLQNITATLTLSASVEVFQVAASVWAPMTALYDLFPADDFAVDNALFGTIQVP
jgi:hypothetical protein